MKNKYLLLSLLVILFIPFVSALPGQVLYQNNGTGVFTNDFQNYLGGTSSLPGSYLGTSENYAINITNNLGSNAWAINNTNDNWNGKVLNLSFIFNDEGQVFLSSYGFSIGFSDSLNTPEPGADGWVSMMTTQCNVDGGHLQLVSNSCELATITRSNGNHSINLLWNTSGTSNNIELCQDGSCVTGSAATAPSTIKYFYFGARPTSVPVKIYNVSICENYCNYTNNNVEFNSSYLTINPLKTNFTIRLNATKQTPSILNYSYMAFVDGVNFHNGTIINVQGGEYAIDTFSVSGTGNYNVSAIAIDGSVNSAVFYSNNLFVNIPVKPNTLTIDLSHDVIMLIIFLFLLFLGFATALTFPFVMIISGMYNIIYALTLWNTDITLALIILLPFGLGLMILGIIISVKNND